MFENTLGNSNFVTNKTHFTKLMQQLTSSSFESDVSPLSVEGSMVEGEADDLLAPFCFHFFLHQMLSGLACQVPFVPPWL
jgi:hypothetical protein